MHKTLLTFCVAMLGLFATQSLIASEQVADDQIRVSGVGEVDAEPDQVTLTVSAYAQEADKATAKQKADAAYEQILDLVKAYGVDDKDVKVQQLSMQPQYEWSDNRRVYRGERVSRMISVVVRDLENLTPLLEGLAQQGVSEVNSMQPGFQDSSALQREALAQAVADAQGKAEFLAKLVKRSVGAVISITEKSSHNPVFARQEMAMAKSMVMDAPPEMLGTQTIRANVEIVFRLN
ncbi:hypothetical protein GCM10008090_30140 [Arenicella chitinivorans]|uniref:DUF541 domain-containing protein n=1 Tax=Arenicella chitinivorans TaxID=1329800 RepID=A0A918VQ23_9GAMM|nr:SIMPL domain-containing protein [Arenicella chitinivorans]GHA18518.1 hypothetical protein GCM10008090_30140 [Arenicella chitinivorans]